MRDLRKVGWVDAWWYTSEILRDPYSHCAAALRGDTRVPHPAEEAALVLADIYRQMKRARNQVGIKPIPRPWAGKAPRIGEPRKPVDSEAAARRRKLLAAASEMAALPPGQPHDGGSGAV